VAALFASLSCRPGTTLDVDTEAGSSGSSTAVESTSTGEVATGELPLVICDPECAAVLLDTWTHEGDPGDQIVSEMIRAADGSIVLGVKRGAGGFRLLRLSDRGELAWSVAPQLPCTVCELVDLDVLPSGDLILSATATDINEPPAAIVARFDIDRGGLVWVRSFELSSGSVASSRAGSVAVLDENRILQLRVDAFSDSESLLLQEVDGDGTTRYQRTLIAQAGTGQAPIFAVAGPQGDVVVAYPWWDEIPELRAAVVRAVPSNYGVISMIELPVLLDDLAVDSVGRRIELAHGEGSDTVTLLVTSRGAADPERWTRSLPLVSTSSTRPTLAIGPDDDVYVAARTTPRTVASSFFVVELSVVRWSADGELRYQGTVPLDMMAVDDPLEMVVDDDDGLIVGTVVQGRLHVGRYEQACACE